jgi:aminopeptidase
MEEAGILEKITRSGFCYPALNQVGNRSKIHWDLVQIQRPDYGGGTICFDGETMRIDGRFIASDLHGLNPETHAGPAISP